MARDYNNWNDTRGNAETTRLNNIPNVTNIINGEKRYYSSIDAEIYLGDKFVDEITTIQWSVQQQAMPIYGYNSYTFDDVAVGSRLVQGQFSVNFLKAGYLKQMQDDPAFGSVSRKIYGVDNKAKSKFEDDFRKRLNTPMWDRGFDIVVGFGDHGKKVDSLKNSMYQTYMVLDCCQITGSMIQLDYNGEPVQEMYTFIARDIKYKSATEAEKNPAGSNGTDTDDTIQRPSKYTVIAHMDLTKNEGSIRLKTKENSKLSSARVTILDNLMIDGKIDKTLNAPIQLSSDPSGDLICILSRDKTKLFKTSCKEIDTLKAEALIGFVGQTSTSSNNEIRKENYTIQITVKTE